VLLSKRRRGSQLEGERRNRSSAEDGFSSGLKRIGNYLEEEKTSSFSVLLKGKLSSSWGEEGGKTHEGTFSHG